MDVVLPHLVSGSFPCSYIRSMTHGIYLVFGGGGLGCVPCKTVYLHFIEVMDAAVFSIGLPCLAFVTCW